MIISTLYDISVIRESLMVLYVAAFVVFGAYVSNFVFADNQNIIQYFPPKTKLLKVNIITISLSLIFFVVKFFLLLDNIDFSSYSTVRWTFLVAGSGLFFILCQLWLWLDLVLSGMLAASIIDEATQVDFTNKGKKSSFLKNYTGLIVIALIGGLLPVFLTGSRSVIVLFFFSFIVSTKNIYKLIKSKFFIFFLLVIVFGLIGLGLLRGISAFKSVFPWDGYLVGPHLLYKNLDQVLYDKNYFTNTNTFIPPGYALFSGGYDVLNNIFTFFGGSELIPTIESIFWKRHLFSYIQVFHNDYNSYYSVGFAIIVEGWKRIGFLSFFLGFFDNSFKNRFAYVIYFSLLCYFLFSISQFSIFQNPALFLLFSLSLIIEITTRFIPLIKRLFGGRKHELQN